LSDVRIGLVGGMANAMYCFTRVLRQQGYDAQYVADPQEMFPMSQPLWEEVPLTLEWRRFGAEPFDAQGWQRLADSSGWRSPDWVVHPKASRPRRYGINRAQTAFWFGPRDATILGRRYVRGAQPMVEQLRSYDQLVVCGIRIADALLSGRPYVFWPHGGDVKDLPFGDATPYWHAFDRLMRKAIAQARLAGTHDPTIAAALEEAGRRGPIPYLPFLVDVDRYAPGEPTSAIARDVRAQAGERRVLLLASRQDFAVKGTDRFARAFTEAVSAGAPLYLVVPPWGADVEATRQIFAEARVLDSVHYLESAVSKPVLRDLYRIADLVVDQFTITAFGSAMLEAMACGTPVLINLDLDAFRDRWPDFVPPPVFRAASQEEIAAMLRVLATDGSNLAQAGSASREWIQEHHGPERARLYVPEAA
jgi:glycosyltransferase involved in cell wall biosynthesis